MSKPDPSAGAPKKSQARSVADLMQYVKQLPSVSDNTSIKAYYGASETLLQQAEGYEASGDSEREFVALMKYVTLLVEKLPKHKQYATAIGKQLKTDNSTKLKGALKRLETLRPLLQQAYEERDAEIRRLAEAEERLKRQREDAERERKQRLAEEQAAKAKAEAAAKAAAEAEVADDDEEDDLLARARKLRLTNSNTPAEASSASRQSNTPSPESDASDGELPALSPEELKAFEAELEQQQNEDINAPEAPLFALPDPHLDELFASGKVLGGIDAIGNSSVAKPDLENVVVPGYAITVTPFTEGVLRPDVVENNPPLIDLSATTRQPTLMMMPSQPSSALPRSFGGAPQPFEQHIMDLSTIPNPTAVSALSPSSPLFAPPPASMPPAQAPSITVAPAPPAQIPTLSAPSAPPLEDVAVTPLTNLAPVFVEASAPPAEPSSRVVAAASKKPTSASTNSSGDGMVMERPRKEKVPVEPNSEIDDLSVLAEPVSASPEVSPKISSSKSERMGELPPPATEKKASPPVSKKVSFEDEVSKSAPPKKSSKKHKSKSSSSSGSSASSRKYAVTPGVAEPDPADADPMLSITRTIRNKQYNPQDDPSLRPRLDAAPTGPTCTNDPPSSSKQMPPTVMPQQQQMVMVPAHGHPHGHHHHQHNHGHLQYARPLPGQPYYVPPPTQPQFIQMHNQQVPVVYSPFQNPQIFQNAQQVVYQPQSQAGSSGGGAVMPVMYGVPLSFRPQMLSIYGQTNKPNQAPAARSAEASAPPLLRSKEPDDSSESSDEEEVIPKPSPKKSSSKGSSTKTSSKASKSSKPKKQPPMIAGLRQIDIDGEIFDSFMRAAHSNTSREIETCGILCGRLNDDESGFSVTHLIVPKQTGTTDTCATTDEEEIFTYQMKKDLLTLGWIHTHPTQACFLSSVDLHTQASYQTLFPEAMAIVIAPKDQPNFSIFHLTNPGLMTVQSCPLKGFHLHDEIRLYEPCSHVRLRWGQKKYKLVDMR